jgi:hypothetical protein
MDADNVVPLRPSEETPPGDALRVQLLTAYLDKTDPGWRLHIKDVLDGAEK